MAFNNLRSQVAYMLAIGLEQRQGQNPRAFHSSMRLWEAQMHHHEYKDKVFVLESKGINQTDSAKSPDIFDSVLMGFGYN